MIFESFDARQPSPLIINILSVDDFSTSLPETSWTIQESFISYVMKIIGKSGFERLINPFPCHSDRSMDLHKEV